MTTIEFISNLHTVPATAPRETGHLNVFDPDYTRHFARSLDEAGYDWTLVPYSSSAADANQLAQFVAHHSERLRPMLAHRPGFLAPTQAARMLATLDVITGGRLGVHVVSGGDDVEQAREGDYGLTKAQRYARSEEYVRILRTIWQAGGKTLDHEGHYYRFEGFATDVVPLQEHLPISVGGSSAEAYRLGGRHGDIFGLWGEPLAETAEQIRAVHEQADAAGRPRPRIWISFRPIVAATDAAAWEKAYALLGAARATAGPDQRDWSPPNTGSQRLKAVAARGDLHDRALWTPMVTATAQTGSTTALVGSYETVAQAILDYVGIGCELIAVRGWDPLADAVDYGRHLLPLVRQELARRPAPKQLSEARP